MKKINSENKNKKKRSIITLYGEVENDHCGYCSNGKSCSFGFESNQLLSFDYDKLMNRGFRRSGSYFYKPVMYKVIKQFNLISLFIFVFIFLSFILIILILILLLLLLLLIIINRLVVHNIQ